MARRTEIVTGGAGFIGSHLVDALLADGARVIVVDDLSSGTVDRIGGDAELEQVDISDAEALDEVVDAARPATIYHLAAQASVTASVADPQRDATVNVIGTLNVLQAARRHGAPVVFTSTGGALYGDEAPLPTSEDFPPEPLSPYGASKLAGESYMGTWRRSDGLAHTVLRLGNVYGPRQSAHGEAGVVAIFSRLLLEGRVADAVRRGRPDARLRARRGRRPGGHPRPRRGRHLQHRHGRRDPGRRSPGGAPGRGRHEPRARARAAAGGRAEAQPPRRVAGPGGVRLDAPGRRSRTACGARSAGSRSASRGDGPALSLPALQPRGLRRSRAARAHPRGLLELPRDLRPGLPGRHRVPQVLGGRDDAARLPATSAWCGRTPRSSGVAAGAEATLFWLTSHIRRVFATDLYDVAEGWARRRRRRCCSTPRRSRAAAGIRAGWSSST